MTQLKRLRLAVVPLTPDRFDDFAALFGPKGAYGGCWCMYFRIPRAAYRAGCAEGGAGNRRAMKALVKKGPPPGLLAYDGDVAVGWCALGPRAAFPNLERSRVAKPVDEKPVWSATCFYVAATHRGKGVQTALLEAAAKHVAARGGTFVEGYPTTPKTGAWAAVTSYVGTIPSFEKAGFTAVAHPTKARAVMRRTVRPKRAGTSS